MTDRMFTEESFEAFKAAANQRTTQDLLLLFRLRYLPELEQANCDCDEGPVPEGCERYWTRVAREAAYIEQILLSRGVE